MRSSPTITITDLHIRYLHHWLFKQFAFELPSNKWCCLLGPSGVGKSTLLRFIADLPYEPGTECSGVIKVSDHLPLKGRLTYLTQQGNLLPWLSIYNNVVLGFRLRNQPINETVVRKANGLLKKVGLAKVSHLKPNQLSAGMQQRAILARALLEDQEVILMDEPFSSLDLPTKIKLQNLAALLLTNRTILLVTHDPLEALRLGELIYIVGGSPVTITHVIYPKGKPPRDIANPDLLEEQAKLLPLLLNS